MNAEQTKGAAGFRKMHFDVNLTLNLLINIVIIQLATEVFVLFARVSRGHAVPTTDKTCAPTWLGVVFVEVITTCLRSKSLLMLITFSHKNQPEITCYFGTVRTTLYKFQRYL